MHYIDELKRHNREDHNRAIPFLSLGLIIVGGTALVLTIFVVVVIVSFYGNIRDPYFSTVQALTITLEDLKSLAGNYLQFLMVASAVSAYAALFLGLIRVIVRQVRKSVLRVLNQSDLLLLVFLCEEYVSEHPQRSSLLQIDVHLDYAYHPAHRPRQGSLDKALYDFINSFHGWCRKLHIRPFSWTLTCTLNALPLALLAGWIWSAYHDFVRQVLAASGHVNPSLSALTFILLIGWIHITFSTIPNARRIGVRQAVIDYFSADDPEAL